MPNWCEDELTVRGPVAEQNRMMKEVRGTGEVAQVNPLDPVEKFVDDLDNSKEQLALDFQKIIPVPVELTGEYAPLPDATPEKDAERIKKYGAKDWYNWCIKFWGTKWNASEPYVSRVKNTLVYSFSTAWSPPEPVVLALSIRYPKLTFTLKFWEGGNGFRGTFKCKAGKVLINNTYDYSGGRGG